MATALFPRKRALLRSWRRKKHQRSGGGRWRPLWEEPLEQRTLLSADVAAASSFIFDADFNDDGRIDVDDLDIVNRWVGPGDSCMYAEVLDITQDGCVDRADVEFVMQLIGTCYGDASLDGHFGTEDIVCLMACAEYEDGIAGNSTWVEGDFNGDGDCTTEDLVLALQHSEYEPTLPAELAAVAAVPISRDLDLNNDGTVDINDLDIVNCWVGPDAGCLQIPEMDVNGDGEINRADVDEFSEILGIPYGDASLDGLFDTSDIVCMMIHDEYEDGIADNSTWVEGDFNGDREFDGADLVLAFQKSVYEPDGDVNRDGRVDVSDIDLVNCWVGASGGQCLYADQLDVNRDETVDRQDVDLVVRIVGTEYGDANLDGAFDSNDLITLMAGGKYMTGEDATWVTGDFNGDHKFTGDDLQYAVERSGFESTTLPVAAVEALFS